MAAIAVGVVGGAIGAVIGGPMGAAIGFSLGSALGGALFPPTMPGVQGPRLADLKVQNSSYGATIPIQYGMVRIAGNVIWATPLRETSVSTTDSVGGKGGGPTQTTTTYSYSVDMAIGLCAGPIAGVLKIWADSTLIYNVSESASVETLLASAAVIDTITVYLGSETQTADPTMEADKGVGNVPSYRGLAYVVLNDFQLAPYGNRVPNFTFEVVQVGSNSSFRKLAQVDNTGIFFHYTGAFGLGDPAILSVDGTMRITTISTDLLTRPVYIFDVNGNYVAEDSRSEAEDFPAYSGVFGLHYEPVGILGGQKVFFVHRTLGELPTINGQQLLFMGDSIAGVELSSAMPTGENIGGAVVSSDGHRLMVFTAPTDPNTGSPINKWYQLNTNGDLVSSGTIAVPMSNVLIGFGNSAEPNPYAVGSLEEDYIHLWTAHGIGTVVRCYAIISGVLTLEFTSGNLESPPGTSLDPGLGYPTIFAKSGIAWAVTRNHSIVHTRLPLVVPSNVAVSTVVSDLCTRAGLAPSDINVSGLTDIIDGYVIANQGPVRSLIEPMQQAFYFDAVESDDVVKFVKRGGSSVATITEDDLSAHEYGQESPDLLTTTRTQEVDLQASVNVLYLNRATDYQQGNQQSRRIATTSKQKLTIEVPIVLTDAKAKNIADVNMYNAWTQRNMRNISVARKYSTLEPTDVITVVTASANYVLRIAQKDEARFGIIKLQCVDEISAVYSQNSVAGASISISSALSLPGDTKLQLMDIPMLRDSDDDAGFYAAVSGFLTGWKGSVLYKSIDDGASYAQLQTLVTASVMGASTTLLGNFSGGNIFDELNTVSVTIYSGTLSGTSELAVLNGANAALIGSEVVQFKTATLVSAGSYILSGLLRGRRGTEWAMSTHTAKDRFILLDAATLRRVPGQTTEIGLSRRYKAASIGNTLYSADSQAFTNSGAALECYSPVQLGGGRKANGDLTITWIRRTRLGGEWRDKVDVSIGEPTLNFEVEIWNSTFTTLRRTISALTVETTIYTSAQQVTDTGSNQAIVYVRVYQLSATVGRGYVLQGQV